MKLALFFIALVLSTLSSGNCTCHHCPKHPEYVCGVDGNSYINRCLSKCQGVTIAYVGQCRNGYQNRFGLQGYQLQHGLYGQHGRGYGQRYWPGYNTGYGSGYNSLHGYGYGPMSNVGQGYGGGYVRPVIPRPLL